MKPWKGKFGELGFTELLKIQKCVGTIADSLECMS